MSKVVFILMFIGSVFSLGVDVFHLKKNINYIELRGVEKRNKLKVYVDYGQEKTKINYIWHDGAIVNFKTMTGAINYFYNQGWVYVDQFQHIKDNKIYYKYILKRMNKDN